MISLSEQQIKICTFGVDKGKITSILGQKTTVFFLCYAKIADLVTKMRRTTTIGIECF